MENETTGGCASLTSCTNSRAFAQNPPKLWYSTYYFIYLFY